MRAHAMTFDLGLGAGTTLKDAVMLGKAFGAAPDVLTALRYEAVRRPRANQLVRNSAAVGAMAAWEDPVRPSAPGSPRARPLRLHRQRVRARPGLPPVLARARGRRGTRLARRALDLEVG